MHFFVSWISSPFNDKTLCFWWLFLLIATSAHSIMDGANIFFLNLLFSKDSVTSPEFTLLLNRSGQKQAHICIKIWGFQG